MGDGDGGMASGGGEAGDGGGGGRKRGGMGFGMGRSRRMGAGPGVGLVRSDSKGDLSEALRIGSPAALQVALWVRVRVLMPLLPLIYMDRESDARKNLRSQLVPALLQLVASPLIWTAVPLPHGSGSPAGAMAPGVGVAPGQGSSSAAPAAVLAGPDGDAAAAAAAGGGLASVADAAAAATAAAVMCGEALHERLLHVLCALVSGQWASWLKPPGQKKLKVGTTWNWVLL